MAVVIETAAFNEAVEIGGKAVQLEAGDERSEVIGMCSDIAGGAAGAGLRGIRAPSRLFLPGLLNILRQSILRIFHLHDADIAELAILDHLARLTDHRIAGVIMR